VDIIDIKLSNDVALLAWVGSGFVCSENVGFGLGFGLGRVQQIAPVSISALA